MSAVDGLSSVTAASMHTVTFSSATANKSESPETGKALINGIIFYLVSRKTEFFGKVLPAREDLRRETPPGGHRIAEGVVLCHNFIMV